MQRLDPNSERGGAIPCPTCGGRTQCIDSRPRKNGIRRRRMCRVCSARFTTLEVIIGADGRGDMPEVYVQRIVDDLKAKHADLANIITDLEAVARLHKMMVGDK